MSVKTQLLSYLRQFEVTVPSLGGKGGRKSKSPSFEEALQVTRRRSQLFFWICVAVLIALFATTLTVGIVYFESLKADAGTLQAIFGATAGSTVILLIRFGREHTRADFLIVALGELRGIDEKGFARLVASLARRWYGLKDAPAKPSTSGN